MLAITERICLKEITVMANQQEKVPSALKQALTGYLATSTPRPWQVLLSVFFLLALALTAVAQQITSSVTGVVIDENKSLVPNAAVVVESTQLSIRRTATTNEEGYFNVPNLPVRLYRVSVQAPGFSDYAQENVKVDVGITLSLNITMTIKQIAQQVDVRDEVYQTINKENANVETLISGTQVTEISLNGRNWAQLVNLAPGTSAISNDSQQGTN